MYSKLSCLTVFLKKKTVRKVTTAKLYSGRANLMFLKKRKGGLKGRNREGKCYLTRIAKGTDSQTFYPARCVL